MPILTKIAIDRWRQNRWRARTDLVWLCNEVLNYPDVSWDVQGPFINRLQKFPVPASYDEAAQHDAFTGTAWTYRPITPMYELPGGRRVLILDPRSFLKTTSNVIAHTIQWILNYPDVSILVVQSTTKKAYDFLREVKKHFQINPSLRALFPEHCPTEHVFDWGTQSEFTTEARTPGFIRKESTVMASSIDAGTAGYHFDVMKFSDIVEQNNSLTVDQNMTVIRSFYMMENLLVRPDSWMDVEGTTYHYCLTGENRILMSDWAHKPIKDIEVGDEVVGWELKKGKRRRLRPSKVLACGSLIAQTNAYTTASGRTITCTPEHKWWRGKQWAKGPLSQEFGTLGKGGPNNVSGLQRLLTPVDKLESADAGWLTGIFDGEGTVWTNKGFPSGEISICQTTHNPEVLERIRQTLTALGFRYSENWTKPSESEGGSENWSDRCIFKIQGGWRERYRFLAMLRPARSQKISGTLYGALMTDRDEIVKIEDAGVQTVYWFQTETGNYIAEGYCSKNSDLYTDLMESEQKKAAGDRKWAIHVRSCYKRVDPASGDVQKDFYPETLDWPYLLDTSKPAPKNEEDPDFRRQSWWPERFPTDVLELRRLHPVQSLTFASQMLNKPKEAVHSPFPWDPAKNYPKILPRDIFTRNVRIAHYDVAVDTADTTSDRSDYTAMVVGGWSDSGVLYIVEIIRARLDQDQMIDEIIRLNRKYRPDKIKIEKTAYVRGMEPALRRIIDLLGEYVPVDLIPISTQISKEERILRTLSPWYKRKEIVFVADCGNLDEVEDEMTKFPNSRFDDVLDAMSDLFQGKEWFGREVARRGVGGKYPEDWLKTKWDKAIDAATKRMLGIEDDAAARRGVPDSPYYRNVTGYN